MTKPKGKKRNVDDLAKRKEINLGQSSQKERNEKWMTQPKE